MDTLAYIVDKYQLHVSQPSPIEIPNVGRNQLAELFAELGSRAGVEVGVESGLYTEVLCKANPEARIWGVDPWRVYPEYREHVTQAKMEGIWQEANERLSSYKKCKLFRETSMEALEWFAPESLDFVYIDGNHELPYVIEDLYWWSKKVRPGGIVAGHDYRRPKKDFPIHVVEAVTVFTSVYHIRPWFVLGRQAKGLDEIRERNRSFMWVKHA